MRILYENGSWLMDACLSIVTVVVFANVTTQPASLRPTTINFVLYLQKVFMFYKFLGGWFRFSSLFSPPTIFVLPFEFQNHFWFLNNFPCLISSCIVYARFISIWCVKLLMLVLFFSCCAEWEQQHLYAVSMNFNLSGELAIASWINNILVSVWK